MVTFSLLIYEELSKVKCDNCLREIKYKTQKKLMKKNMYEFQCPNCNTLLKATKISITHFAIVIGLSFLVFSFISSVYWVKAVVMITWLPILYFYILPFILKYKSANAN